ncbi:MAG: DUF167 domain-containing protein [Chloroflexi bacterium]|nr:DUF167 domain-containing protein [Chloroflexota bacterium]
MTAHLDVRVQPGAKRESVTAQPDGSLRVSVRAPALEGRANRAVEELLAKTLGIPRSRVRIIRGESARQKVVEVETLDAEECLRRIGS